MNGKEPESFLDDAIRSVMRDLVARHDAGEALPADGPFVVYLMGRLRRLLAGEDPRAVFQNFATTKAVRPKTAAIRDIYISYRLESDMSHAEACEEITRLPFDEAGRIDRQIGRYLDFETVHHHVEGLKGWIDAYRAR